MEVKSRCSIEPKTNGNKPDVVRKTANQKAEFDKCLAYVTSSAEASPTL